MNNDLISRETLKEKFDDYIKANPNISGIFELGKFIIDNAPTVVNENLTGKRQQGEWIPIKIRELTEEEKEEYPDCTFMYDCPLPEDGEEVYITTFSGNTTLDTFYRDDGCYFESYCDAEDVIAWMPKPEPYKKGCAE